MTRLIKLLKILAIMLPGIFTYHAIFNIFKDIDFLAPTWLVALAAAVYVSSWTYKQVNGLAAKTTKTAMKRERKVSVVMSHSKAKKLGLV